MQYVSSGMHLASRWMAQNNYRLRRELKKLGYGDSTAWEKGGAREICWDLLQGLVEAQGKAQQHAQLFHRAIFLTASATTSWRCPRMAIEILRTQDTWPILAKEWNFKNGWGLMKLILV